MTTTLAHVRMMHANGASDRAIHRWLSPITTPAERRHIVAALKS